MLALPQLHHLIPDGELTSIKITRAEPSEPLAISIVGGNETPLVRILIQDIYREGVIARDGRLLPGDMILKVLCLVVCLCVVIRDAPLSMLIGIHRVPYRSDQSFLLISTDLDH